MTIELHFEDNETDVTMYLSLKKKQKPKTKKAGVPIENH